MTRLSVVRPILRRQVCTIPAELKMFVPKTTPYCLFNHFNTTSISYTIRLSYNNYELLVQYVVNRKWSIYLSLPRRSQLIAGPRPRQNRTIGQQHAGDQRQYKVKGIAFPSVRDCSDPFDFRYCDISTFNHVWKVKVCYMLVLMWAFRWIRVRYWVVSL
jgi:hypothetical protein